MLQDNSGSSEDWWDELSTEQKDSIMRGLKDADEGKVVTYEHVKELVKSWLTKSNSQPNQ